MSVAGIVLAAGRSVRAGRAKALAELDGETWLARTVRAQLDGGVSHVVVVVAEPHAAAIARALPAGARLVRNAAPSRGMLGSLQVALRVVEAERVVVSLVDHPRVRGATVRALLGALDEPGVPVRPLVVRPQFAGRRGHPYVVAGAAIAALRDAPTERSTREVLRELAPALDVDVDDPGVLDDFDGPVELGAPDLLSRSQLA